MHGPLKWNSRNCSTLKKNVLANKGLGPTRCMPPSFFYIHFLDCHEYSYRYTYNSSALDLQTSNTTAAELFVPVLPAPSPPLNQSFVKPFTNYKAFSEWTVGGRAQRLLCSKEPLSFQSVRGIAIAAHPVISKKM